MQVLGKDNRHYIQSPLNYTGGKYKLLSQLLPLFPDNINCFVDLFCGGCNVGINVRCNTVLFNDLNRPLLYLYNTFKNLDKDLIFALIYKIIDDYKLSLVSKYGYEYYGCESSKGLGAYNRERFIRLRDDFNNNHNEDYYYYLMLYVLIVYAFNNQIRFNSNGKYNLPVGKRDFNTQMHTKLDLFIERIKAQDCIFSCKDFRELDISLSSYRDFVYVDPPYLITCASYNEQDGWTEKDEKDLLSFLDSLDKKGIRFALSNVLRSKGRVNELLVQWLEANRMKYVKHNLNYNYSNSNYHTKDKTAFAEEVLITNY